jgi:glycosyltransferase involved in cell wall biosynthesis
MHILHVISSLDGRDGGTSWACAGMAVAQARTQLMKVSLCSTFREGERNEIKVSLDRPPSSVHRTEIGPTQYPLRWHPKLSRTLTRLIASADIVQIHGMWEEIQYRAAKVAIRCGKPVVLSPHGMLDPWSLAQGRWKKNLYIRLRWRALFPHISAFHFVTSSETRLARKILPEHVFTIIEPLGVELPASSKPRLDLSRSEKQLLFLSRLHPKKNLEFLLEVLAGLKDLPWKLNIAGDGEIGYVRKLKDRLNEFHLQDRVCFLGALQGEAKWSAFQNSDLFLLPSHQENFGIVVAEALVCDVPVMLSPAVGLGEDYVGKPGINIVPLDLASWRGWLRAQLQSPAVSSSATWAKEVFAWHEIGKRWGQHYRQLLPDQVRTSAEES